MHPVAWDDLCAVPFPGLCRLLATRAGIDRDDTEREIDRLIDSYPSQRMEALKARALVLARDAAGEADLAWLDERVAGLPEGDSGFLKEVPTLKAMVAEITQRQRRLDAVQVPAFREALAAGLVVAIEDFRNRVAGLRYPLAQGFRAAAERGWPWRDGSRRRRAGSSGLRPSRKCSVPASRSTRNMRRSCRGSARSRSFRGR